MFTTIDTFIIYPINFAAEFIIVDCVMIHGFGYKHSQLENRFDELLKPLFNPYGTYKHLGGMAIQ